MHIIVSDVLRSGTDAGGNVTNMLIDHCYHIKSQFTGNLKSVCLNN